MDRRQEGGVTTGNRLNELMMIVDFLLGGGARPASRSQGMNSIEVGGDDGRDGDERFHVITVLLLVKTQCG